MSIKFEKLTPNNFNDFKSLMCSDGVSGQCFCLSHRVEPKDLELEELACQKMQSLVSRRKVHGLVAYIEGVPGAWVAVDPYPELVGHDAYDALLESPQSYGPSDWCLHCLFVAPTFRAMGLCSALIDQAIDYATQRGAQRILAFPMPDVVYLEEGLNDRYSGKISDFAPKGFSHLRDLTPKMSLCVKEIGQVRTRLSVV